MRGIDEALERLAAGGAAREELDRVGYVVLADLIEPDRLCQLRAEFERLMTRQAPGDGGPRTGTRHIPDTDIREAALEGTFALPSVLAAVHNVLHRPFTVFQLSGRDPLPGYGQQGLHADWLPRAATEPYSIVTAILLLDDFTPENGATRLVPGSHLLPRPLPKSMAAPASRHPDQVVVVAKAGSVLVFNGHTWHGGTRNDSSGPRRVLQCQFVARDRTRPVGPRSSD